MAIIPVTAGLGSLGSCPVGEFELCGHDVWVAEPQWFERKQYYRCDINEHRQLARIFDHRAFDFVHHLAAEIGRMNGEHFYETMWRSNVIRTKHMLQLHQEHGFKMIFFSSSEVYDVE
jgi:dTDP-glucose 4,6-dehydratase